MSLRDRLTDEMKVAMKSRDGLRLSTIRLIRSAVKNREIELRREFEDSEIIEVIASMIKQRRESIRLFTQGARTDLVEKEEKELLACSSDFSLRSWSGPSLKSWP